MLKDWWWDKSLFGQKRPDLQVAYRKVNGLKLRRELFLAKGDYPASLFAYNHVLYLPTRLKMMNCVVSLTYSTEQVALLNMKGLLLLYVGKFTSERAQNSLLALFLKVS